MALKKVESYDSSVMISSKDANEITGMELGEIRKAIKAAGLEGVAELKTGKKGRPPKLFARDELLSAIAAARAAAEATAVPTVASEVAEDLSEDLSSVDDFDSAVA